MQTTEKLKPKFSEDICSEFIVSKSGFASVSIGHLLKIIQNVSSTNSQHHCPKPAKCVIILL